MPVDASIYQGVNTAPMTMPSVADAAKNAMTLSQLAMQNRQMQLQNQTNQTVNQSYQKNTDPNGKLNQQAFLSDVGKVNPSAAMQYQQQFSTMGKADAENQKDQADAYQKKFSLISTKLDYLAGMSQDKRAAAYPQVMDQLQQQGVIKPGDAPAQYDDGWFRQTLATGQKMKDSLDNQKTSADISKTYSDIGQAPAKLNSELYGSRSPNAELTSQYDKQAQPVRNSQMAMQQMLDNYKNPSPQGDKSLILNAFRIKFPNAPDVNSLEELTKAQSVPDSWKATATHALEGGLDQATRDNLMRDGVSTFRANVDSLKGIQQRYQGRAQQQNVNDPTITSEPAIDKTFDTAMNLQKQIGPYVPPADRGGFMAGVNKFASKLIGIGGAQSASAAPSASAPKHGTVDSGYVFLGGDPSDKSNWKKQ